MLLTAPIRSNLALLVGLLALALGVAEDANASASACLLEGQNEPCQLLEEGLVRSALGDLAVQELDQKSYSMKPRAPRKGRRRTPPTNISNCTYRWPSTMKRSIKMPGNSTMTVPRDAEGWLTGIVEYPEQPLSTFERTHRTPTPEELARLNERVDKQLAKAQAEGKVNEAGRSVGKGIAKRATEGIRYSEVSGLGDAALWESKSSQLSVLVDAVKFDVHAFVSEDAAENERIAKAIAVGLLRACK